MPITPLSGSPSKSFLLEIDRGAKPVTIRVYGEVDAATAPALEAAITGLRRDGEIDLAVDLGGLRFIASAGLRVITETAAGLASAHGALRLRSPSAQTRRLLAVTGMSALVDGDGDRPLELTGSPNPSNAAVVDAALRVVTVLAAATVTGADGASVCIHRNGRMTTVAASDETVLRMDQHQYDTGEGPCLTAAAERDGIHVESVVDERRWPRFIPLARDEGIASILSTPLVAGDRSVGALNIYSNTMWAFGRDQQELAVLLADQAAVFLGDAGGPFATRSPAEVDGALRDREVIAQAQGVLMAREHLTERAATANLHRAARTGLASVADHAAAIVASAGPSALDG